MRRVADQWKAANPEESFEIVKRRLFTAPDGEALARISATANAVVKFYRQHHSEFPSEVTENAYLDRIRATRESLQQNAAPVLALESLLITVASGRTP